MSMKSKVACEFSIQRIENPYLWTFTLPMYLEPKVAAGLWGALAGDLVRHVGMSGIRVFEPHPGGHGLHVHAVVSGWFPVSCVRHYALHHGWGRIHVCKIAKGAGVYIAKYLNKSKRVEGWKGIRLWAAFGLKNAVDWSPSKVKDIECDCPEIQLYRKFAEHVKPTSREARRKLWKKALLVHWGVLNYQLLSAPPARRVRMGGDDLWTCADTIEISAGLPSIKFERVIRPTEPKEDGQFGAGDKEIFMCKSVDNL